MRVQLGGCKQRTYAYGQKRELQRGGAKYEFICVRRRAHGQMSKGPSKENGALVRPLKLHMCHHAHAAGREPAALLAEPITFFWRNTSTSPAQRLGVTRRLHIGLATCQRGVQMGARPIDGAAGAWCGGCRGGCRVGRARRKPDGAQRASQEACNQTCDSAAVEGGAGEP